MTTFEDIADKVVEAFETEDVDEALSRLTEAFWNTTETKKEMADFIATTERKLRKRGDATEADFCKKLLRSSNLWLKKSKKVTYTCFIAEILRLTKWVEIPSPARYAEEYIERTETRCHIAGALLGALVEHRAERGRHLRAVQEKEDAQQERCNRVRGIVRRTAFAVGTFGATELASLAMGEDVTDFS